MYVTPERFRTMGLGSDLEGLEDWELRSILNAASALVDTYCNVPMLPQKHSFRGGTITGEKHQWGDDMRRRVYLWHTPIKAVTSVRVMATRTQYLQMNTNDLYVNPSGGYAEVVALALTSYGLWGAAMPGLGLYTPVSEIDYTYGYEFPVTGEYLDPTDAWTWRAQNQFWTDADVTVYINGTETSDDLTLDREEGTVRFDDPHDPSDVVTIDYTYSLPRDIAQATALAAATMLSEKDLMAKGLGQLAEISVEEVRLRRDARKTGTVVASEALPDSAKAFLSGYRFVTVM